MKILLILIFSLLIFSCNNSTHCNYTVEVTYINGDIDTIKVDYTGKSCELWVDTYKQAVPILKIGTVFVNKSIAYNIMKYRIIK